MIRKYLTCDCGSLEHTLRISYFEEDPDLYIETFLYRPNTFLKRLWVAIKYVFKNKECKYGQTSEFIMNESQAKEFNTFLSEFVIKKEQLVLLNIIVELIKEGVFKVGAEQDVYNFAVMYKGFRDLLHLWYNETNKDEKSSCVEDIQNTFNDIDVCTSVLDVQSKGNKNA